MTAYAGHCNGTGQSEGKFYTRGGTTHMITKRAVTLIFFAVLAVGFALQGCGSSGSSGSTAWWGSESAAKYTVSGKIISPVSLQPVEGMTCTLQLVDRKGTKSSVQTTTTDAEGAYSFSGLEAGTYRMITSRSGHITDNSYFTVSQDMTVNQTSLKTDEWTTVMGTDHPYDPSMAYVSAIVDHTGGGTPPVTAGKGTKDPGKDGVVVDLFSQSKAKGSGYQARCYMDTQGRADWSATSTSSTGVALFYKTSPTDTYTLTATKSGHVFDNVASIAPVQGEFTNYMMNAKGSGTKPLKGLCFGPYIKEYDPQDPDRPPNNKTEQELEALIAPIANYTEGIRTYSSANGLEAIPMIAKRHGLKVVACAWLDGTNTSGVSAKDHPQILNLLKAADEHYVDIALVGSEATNNGVDVEVLKQYITDTKKLMQGKTTASGSSVQVASGLMFSDKEANNKEVVDLCDVLFVHVYPCYAEPTTPDGVHHIGIDGSDPANIRSNLDWAYGHFKELYPDVANGTKPMIIGEIGWATAGVNHGESVFNENNAVVNLKAVKEWSEANGVDYYYFEAYDEPWKAFDEPGRNYEGHFGLWDSSMNLKSCFDFIRSN